MQKNITVFRLQAVSDPRAYSPKIAKTGNFWYKFSPNGYTRINDFLAKFGLGTDSQVHTLTPNFTAVAFKMWVYSPQNFWYKVAPKGTSGGPQKKLNIGQQLQTFLYAMAA